eukprot:Gb_08911 [translate_table: standard]
MLVVSSNSYDSVCIVSILEALGALQYVLMPSALQLVRLPITLAFLHHCVAHCVKNCNHKDILEGLKDVVTWLGGRIIESDCALQQRYASVTNKVLVQILWRHNLLVPWDVVIPFEVWAQQWIDWMNFGWGNCLIFQFKWKLMDCLDEEDDIKQFRKLYRYNQIPFGFEIIANFGSDCGWWITTDFEIATEFRAYHGMYVQSKSVMWDCRVDLASSSANRRQPTLTIHKVTNEPRHAYLCIITPYRDGCGVGDSEGRKLGLFLLLSYYPRHESLPFCISYTSLLGLLQYDSSGLVGGGFIEATSTVHCSVLLIYELHVDARGGNMKIIILSSMIQGQIILSGG